MEMATSRALYAMSRDGLFFPFFARVNKGGVPGPSLWLSTAVGLCFAMFTFERVAAILASFFRGRLWVIVCVAVRATAAHSGERTAVSGMGLSVDDRGGARGFDRVLGGALATDRENTPLTSWCSRLATRYTGR